MYSEERTLSRGAGDEPATVPEPRPGALMGTIPLIGSIPTCLHGQGSPVTPGNLLPGRSAFAVL